MAKVWVAGFTRKDGTKVAPHWREVKKLSIDAVAATRKRKLKEKELHAGPKSNFHHRSKGSRLLHRRFKTSTVKSWREDRSN